MNRNIFRYLLLATLSLLAYVPEARAGQSDYSLFCDSTGTVDTLQAYDARYNTFYYVAHVHNAERAKPKQPGELLDKSYAEIIEWKTINRLVSAGMRRYISRTDLIIPDSLPVPLLADGEVVYFKVKRIQRLLHDTPEQPQWEKDARQYNAIINHFEIGKYVAVIGDSAFSFMDIRQSRVTIPESVDTVCTGAFMNVKLDTLVLEPTPFPLFFITKSDYSPNVFAPREECWGDPHNRGNVPENVYRRYAAATADHWFPTIFYNPEWPIKYFYDKTRDGDPAVPPCVNHLEMGRNIKTLVDIGHGILDDEFHLFDRDYGPNFDPFAPYGVRSIAIGEKVDSLTPGFMKDFSELLADRSLVVYPAAKPLKMPVYLPLLAVSWERDGGNGMYDPSMKSPYQFEKVAINREINSTYCPLSKKEDRRTVADYIFENVNIKTLFYGTLPEREADGSYNWESVK